MLNPGKLKIYGASAGSGKTYTLVYEVLLLLLKNDSTSYFKHILAITFTNKAAAEMKERLLEALGEFSSDDYGNSKILEKLSDETGLPIDVLHRKAKGILSEILHNYSQFNVSTIDTFNLRLMRAFSQDLGLAMNFDVDMDFDERITESIDLVLSKLSAKSTLTKALTSIAVENMEDAKSWDIKVDLIEKTKKVFKDDFLEEIKILKELSVKDLNNFRKIVNERYNHFKSEINLIATATNDLIETEDIPISSFRGGKSGGLGHYINRIAQGAIAYPSNSLLNNIEEDKRYSGKAKADEKQKIDSIWDQSANSIKTIEQLISYLFFWNKIRKTVKSLMVFNEIDKELNSIKEEENFLMIGDFNKIIGEHISSQPAPFIYERIGTKFNHYFIDEFQDTSSLQWNNFQPLVSNALATEDTVMLVGDPKQSIYRFRGGNPELMIDLITSENDKDSRVEVKNLDTNYRSYDTIIEFNNSFFTLVAEELSNDDFAKLYRTGNNQSINQKSGGFVKINFIEKEAKVSVEEWNELSLIQLLEDVTSSIEAGFSLSEMAILASKRAELVMAADYLSKNGIDVISDESLLLQNSAKVKLLLALIQFISNPLNFEYRAGLIIQLFNNKVLLEDATSFYLKTRTFSASELIEELKEFGIDLSNILSNGYSLLDKIELAIRVFNWDESSDAYISSFLDHLLKLHLKEPGANAFLEFWDKKKDKLSIKLPPNLNAIRLLTIHKSKGLQFPVVFMPFANFGYKNDNGIWIDVPEEKGSKVKRFYVADTNDFDRIDPNVQAKIEHEQNLEEFNALNLQYVAQTRAVEQLYINTIKAIKPNDKIIGTSNICSPLYYKYADKEGKGETDSLTFGLNKKHSSIHNQINETEDVLLKSSDWLKTVRISSEHAFLMNKERSEAIIYGNKLHAILEQIEDKKDVNSVINTFGLEGLINKEETVELQKTLQTLFGHPSLSKFFNKPEVVWNERDFISDNGQVFRPDRMVKVQDEWYLLDYKTGNRDDSHKMQINQYVDEFEKMNIQVKNAYIVYLNSEIEVETITY